MTKVAEPRQQLQLKFSIKSPLFDFGSGWSVPLGPMQIKYMPNLGSIRAVAVKHHHAQNWEPHLSCPVPRIAWDGNNFRFFGKSFRFPPKNWRFEGKNWLSSQFLEAFRDCNDNLLRAMVETRGL